MVKDTALPAAAQQPLIVATSSEGEKRNKYGNVMPCELLPFVVEHGGALGKEAAAFFKRCAKTANDRLGPAEQLLSTWSSRTFTSYFHHQQFSVANLRGSAHLLRQQATALAGMPENAI